MDQEFIDKKKKTFLSGLSFFFLLLVFLSVLFSTYNWQWPFSATIFILGVVLLIEGADWIVHSSTHLARSLGMPPVVIGLLFVACMTSIPEFAVTLYASFTGKPDIALGTLIGSNIATIGLVIGIAAMISPLVVHSFTILLETPFLLLSSVLIFVLSFRLFDFGSSTYVLGKIDGLILLLFFLMFLVYTRHQIERKESKTVQKKFFKEFSSESGKSAVPLFRTLFVFFVGLFAVFLGAKFVVTSATLIARGFGVSEAIIGLTLIAVGTTLPELMISIVGILKKEYDLVIGNILGSNIITLLFISGFTAVLHPYVVDTHILFIDMLVLVLFCVLFQVFITTDKTITRTEGAILFICYLIYFFYLIWYAFY